MTRQYTCPTLFLPFQDIIFKLFVGMNDGLIIDRFIFNVDALISGIHGTHISGN